MLMISLFYGSKFLKWAQKGGVIPHRLYSDIMSLHVYCSKYGRHIPQKLPSQSGALKFNLPNYMLENFLKESFKINKISQLLVWQKEL